MQKPTIFFRFGKPGHGLDYLSAGALDDMDEDTANALFEDMDFDYNKVKCPKIEQQLPKLMKMVEGDMKSMGLTRRGNIRAQ